MHDDATELADKKCRLLWANEAYDKMHDELMQTLRRGNRNFTDSAGAQKGEVSGPEYIDNEKQLTNKLDALDDEIKDLNKDIDKLNEKYYEKYDDKGMAALTREVKSLVARCKP